MSKFSNKFSKIYRFDPPPRAQKLEKSKKSNIFSKIDHFYLPEVEKSKNPKYSVKSDF